MSSRRCINSSSEFRRSRPRPGDTRRAGSHGKTLKERTPRSSLGIRLFAPQLGWVGNILHGGLRIPLFARCDSEAANHKCAARRAEATSLFASRCALRGVLALLRFLCILPGLLLRLLVGLMFAHTAPDRGTRHAVTTRDMPGRSTDCGALDAPLGASQIGDERKRDNQCGSENSIAHKAPVSR